MLGVSIPRPAALVTFDHEKKEINSSSLVVGSRAIELLEHVHAITGVLASPLAVTAGVVPTVTGGASTEFAPASADNARAITR